MFWRRKKGVLYQVPVNLTIELSTNGPFDEITWNFPVPPAQRLLRPLRASYESLDRHRQALAAERST